MHINLQLLSSAGWLPSITVGTPGTQGELVAGMHGTGVSTPRAAAVAAATIGLVGVVHMPKGKILTKGLWSMMLAAGIKLVITKFKGKTLKVLGARPKEHCSVAPVQTC